MSRLTSSISSRISSPITSSSHSESLRSCSSQEQVSRPLAGLPGRLPAGLKTGPAASSNGRPGSPAAGPKTGPTALLQNWSCGPAAGPETGPTASLLGWPCSLAVERPSGGRRSASGPSSGPEDLALPFFFFRYGLPALPSVEKCLPFPAPGQEWVASLPPTEAVITASSSGLPAVLPCPSL